MAGDLGGSNESSGDQTNNPGLSKRIGNVFRKHFYGHEDRRWISVRDRGKIGDAISEAFELDRASHKRNKEIQKEEGPLKKRAEATEDEDKSQLDMLSRAVVPELFRYRYEKLDKSYSEVYKLHRTKNDRYKQVTSRNVKELLSQLKTDCDELKKLVGRLRKTPEDMQKEAKENLPELVKKADTILKYAKSIDNEVLFNDESKEALERNQENIKLLKSWTDAYNEWRIVYSAGNPESAPCYYAYLEGIIGFIDDEFLERALNDDVLESNKVSSQQDYSESALSGDKVENLSRFVDNRQNKILNEFFESLKNKSEKRKVIMPKKLIKLGLEMFYGHEIKDLTYNDKSKINELKAINVLKGNIEDYCCMEASVKTPEQEKPTSFRQYRALINVKAGEMISTHVWRDTDQQWRNKNFPPDFKTKWAPEVKKKGTLEKIPEEFWKALHPSDLKVFLYQKAVDANTNLKDNTCLFPLRVVVGTGILYKQADDILSRYVTKLPPPYVGIPPKASYSSPEEGFLKTLTTHFGKSTQFMLYDYPEIVGDGEIKRVVLLGYRDPEVVIEIGEKKA